MLKKINILPLVNNQKLQPTGFKSSSFHWENTDKNNILLL